MEMVEDALVRCVVVVPFAIVRSYEVVAVFEWFEIAFLSRVS